MLRHVLRACFLIGLACSSALATEPMKSSYPAVVLADGPVAYWRFEADNRNQVANRAREAFAGKAQGQLKLAAAGPRPARYTAFSPENKAAAVNGQNGFVRVADNGEDSPLDFADGDAITLEAWVNLHALGEGTNVYLFGKGRTNNEGFARENQNYALRLRGIGGTARVSFLFRSTAGGKEGGQEFHRWNSSVGFAPQSGWHHVAVTYIFGQPETIRGYLDGQPVKGAWDMGGPTKSPPVVDNDELWIGSALGGSGNNTLNGLIDEVAIYRKALSPKQIAAHVAIDEAHPAVPETKLPEPPPGKVLVQIFEGTGGSFTPTTKPVEEFELPALMLSELPRKYNSKGLIADWQQPVLMRMVTRVPTADGDQTVLLRAKDQTRLRIDDRIVAQTKAIKVNGSGHEKVPQLLATDAPNMHPAAMAHQEQRAEVSLTGGQHLFVIEAIIGTGGSRPEIGELTAALGTDGQLQLISPSGNHPLTTEEMTEFLVLQRQSLHQLNTANRRRHSLGEDEYWQQRHAKARAVAEKRMVPKPPEIQDDHPIHNEIDRFIAAELIEASIPPAGLTSDEDFLRRVTLDTTGVIPTREEIAAFVADKSPQRRAKVIDRLLKDPRWADHWTSYWQDVLAENPNVLKGKLNNTGPFRWWIYESLLDNKPVDRFATELIMMEGSKYYGGPAGFGMATQNDAPMAAKAHVISKAFLGVEMQCARCHDAPYHEVTQEDTFSLAAMLQRGQHKIPKTSVVPTVEGARPPEVTVALKPGQAITPKWPFAELASGEVDMAYRRKSDDSRDHLAAIITSPANERFAKVVVNRLWARLLGRGLVSPVDDWEGVDPSHPALLDWLARELVLSGYDQKHVARLILNSHTYQRRIDAAADADAIKLFAAPTRRRMTAEQVVDSLFAAAGKPMGAEMVSLDPEGRRPAKDFLNLGVPTRAWHLASLSNERDRPALSLPVAQSVLDVLKAYGWRETRQDPITIREGEPTVLQPAVLANGTVGRRIVGLSDDSELTQLALAAKNPTALVEATYQQVLSRSPDEDELSLFVELLTPGFESRQVKDVVTQQKAAKRHAVSWANHLNAEATKIKLELEAAARAGDPPSSRLQDQWRERMEDMAWALVNSPEFVFVP